MTTKTFAELGVPAPLVRALSDAGLTHPFPIQVETLPDTLAGRDVLGRGKTGSGKTLAFSIPLVTRLSQHRRRPSRPAGLVLAPTRELAMQIVQELSDLARFIPQVKIAALYGGQPITRQLNQLKRKPQIVVATPGRMLDMVSRGHISLHHVHTMVIDEADEMLNMGFVKDVTRIIELAPPGRQLVMFSATTNRDVMTISWKYQREPVEITVEATKENRPQIAQHTMQIPRDKKMEALQYLLDSEEFDRVMVFVNTKFMAQRLSDKLVKEGYGSQALHGDIRQSQRTRVMGDFKRGKFPILVATDVAARGIDVDDVEAVINYDLPNENEYYLHRIGRTGRAPEARRVLHHIDLFQSPSRRSCAICRPSPPPAL